MADLAFRDIRKEPLSREEVGKLAGKMGGAAALFSRRARKYRERGLHEEKLSEKRMLDLMAEEYTFLTRPAVVIGGRGMCGFREARYRQWLASAGR